MLYNPHFTELYKTLGEIYRRYQDDIGVIDVTWKEVKDEEGTAVQYLPNIRIVARGFAYNA